MKRMRLIMLVALIGLMGISPVFAADFVNLSVSAQVANTSPELTLEIKELTEPGQSPYNGATVTTMNFGPLRRTLDGGADAGVWYSQKYYCVLIYPQSYGHQYEVRSACTGLTSGGNSLPAGSFMLSPQHAAADEWSAGDAQGELISGETLGDEGPAVTTGGSYKVIFNSSTGRNRILRAIYSLPVDADTPIPLSQPSGTYSGTVTITIAQL